MRTLTIVERPEGTRAPHDASVPSPRALAGDTSILVVAEHAIVRAGLRAVLGATPGFVIAGEARDLAEAAALALRCRPDVVLLEAMPAPDAPLTALRRNAPAACLLALADEAREGSATVACVPRESGVEQLCATIGVLLGGRCAACALRSQCPAPRLAAALSPRERQVAVRVAAGLTSKQIAAALGVSLRTVNTYRESLSRKLGASSAAVLTRYVLAHGLDAEPAGIR